MICACDNTKKALQASKTTENVLDLEKTTKYLSTNFYFINFISKFCVPLTKTGIKTPQKGLSIPWTYVISSAVLFRYTN